MSSYLCCTAAIKAMEQSKEGSNVSGDASLVRCGHIPTECKWVGNGSFHACLKKPCEAPQRVHYKHNGGNGGRLG